MGTQSRLCTNVIVETVTKDRYKRAVGIVKVNGIILNGELIREGFAWVYTKYCKMQICKEWKRLESEAREKRHGLWQDPNPIPP